MKYIIAFTLLLMIACTNTDNLSTPKTSSSPNDFKVNFKTSKGDIVLNCHKDWGPIGAARIYELVKKDFFNNIIFFRNVPEFVVQFGISGDPSQSAIWRKAVMKDDPVKTSNKAGTLTFATAGPNSRTTQLFINLSNNSRLDNMGFTPICEIFKGMDVVNKLYNGYGEAPSQQQSKIQAEGNTFLKKNYPKLDYIIEAKII